MSVLNEHWFLHNKVTPWTNVWMDWKQISRVTFTTDHSRGRLIYPACSSLSWSSDPVKTTHQHWLTGTTFIIYKTTFIVVKLHFKTFDLLDYLPDRVNWNKTIDMYPATTIFNCGTPTVSHDSFEHVLSSHIVIQTLISSLKLDF